MGALPTAAETSPRLARRNCDFQMERYTWRRKPDGVHPKIFKFWKLCFLRAAFFIVFN